MLSNHTLTRWMQGETWTPPVAAKCAATMPEPRCITCGFIDKLRENRRCIASGHVRRILTLASDGVVLAD